MRLSLRWAERSKRAHDGTRTALFGIAQADDRGLARRVSPGLANIGFRRLRDRRALVASSKREMTRVLAHTAPAPRGPAALSLGVGPPRGHRRVGRRGLDMFDGGLPTRNPHRAGSSTRYGDCQESATGPPTATTPGARTQLSLLQQLLHFSRSTFSPPEGELDPRRPAQHRPHLHYYHTAYARAPRPRERTRRLRSAHFVERAEIRG